MLKSFGEQKIQVIKAVRSVTSLALKEAKQVVEEAPSTIKEALPKEEAEKIAKILEKKERIVKPPEMVKLTLSKETLIQIDQNELKVNVWRKNE